MLYALARYGIPEDNWHIRAANYDTDLDGVVIVQKDSHNCGPIACMTLWKIFRPTENEIAKLGIVEYRNVAMAEFKRLLEKYMDNMVVSSRNSAGMGNHGQRRKSPRIPIEKD